ncbi:MAG TPA: N-acetyl-gamma-glutamyl-phosphate reductase [Egibacteraceae bacterium]|nr:N-acetyl-gamma-glutamyl-phosphate reductase [Egibacteraceae bacterium]
MNVGVVGGSGYGGAELVRLLAAHPALKLRTVAGKSAAGKRLDSVFPHLLGVDGADQRLTPATPEQLKGCDLVFLATPHEVSLDLAPALLAQGSAVVDLSGAFRLAPDVFAEWYGLPHIAPDLSPAVYGLPELFRDQIADARLVANPGCYPTAALLAMAPLAELVEPGSVVINGMSGASGAGKGLRDDLHLSHATANVAPYGAPRHRHTPEIEAIWGALVGAPDPPAVTFTPHLVPMARGELCTVVARLLDGAEAPDVSDAFVGAFAAETFVSFLGMDQWPATTHVIGGNGAHIGAAVDPRTRRVTVACASDNLVKGASGQAIQNANLMLGLPETAGLSPAGVYP